VLLVERLDEGVGLRLPRLDAGERQVFLGVVQRVGVMSHVEHDVQHELIVGRAAVVKELELSLQAIEEPAEVDVVGVPSGECAFHGGSLRRYERVRRSYSYGCHTDHRAHARL
jgi:hypothetical protein